ncbi:potassium channel family protein [Bernardetia sp.]|uniref:potassium channel family protein n=1 Tax=Bernardetia sp. TaxID=1937974 RepID=UPI0025BC80BC|nr:TrkA family potassium uptake protein [Bernardetia sp.]
MADKFAVIGLGHFGYAVARNLAARGAEVLAIDRDIERVESIKDDVAYAVALDATDIKALSSQNVADMDAVLVAIGENIEGLLLTTVQLLELNVKRIIARAMADQQRLILEKLGVKEILSPEDEVGKLVAEKLLNPNMKAFLPLPDNYSIVEIQAPRRIVNKKVGQVRFSDNYALDLITIKRVYEEYHDGRKQFAEHLINRPTEDIAIEQSDVLIVLGKSNDVEKFVELNR